MRLRPTDCLEGFHLQQRFGGLRVVTTTEVISVSESQLLAAGQRETAWVVGLAVECGMGR